MKIVGVLNTLVQANFDAGMNRVDKRSVANRKERRASKSRKRRKPKK